jgi:hypothetical protein
MSPEQLFHPKEIDLRTDLWATAVLVYRCLTGSFPFEGESFASVCLSVSKGKFTTPSAVNSVLPGGLDAWFKKAFHKNLDARFASAAEMSEAFLNELRKADLLPPWAEATEAPPSGTTQASPRFLRSSRRPGARRAGLVSIAAALMAVLGYQVAPPSARVMVADLTAQAAELARGWAVNEGLYPSLGSDDVSAAKGATEAMEVRWLTPPMTIALAERDVLHLDGGGPAAVARGNGNRDDRRAFAPSPVDVDFDPSAPATLDLAAAPAAPAATPATTAAVSTTSAKEAPASAPTDLATIRFGL